tara:strand:- start:44561 stop:45937 length:1377 start_codon:yes stop_codon:yes gene_type:complete
METERKIYIGGSMSIKNRPSVVITGPFTSRSGYGEHARDIFHSLRLLNKFNIKLFDVRWGNCPRNALNLRDGKDLIVSESIVVDPNLISGHNSPDIYIDVRIPNEFQPIGKFFNIGITAGIETTAVSQQWLEGCNRMDMLIVPSNHSKKAFVDTAFDKLEKLPTGGNHKVGELKLEKPMEVLFEGSDDSIYKQLKIDEMDKNVLDDINSIVKEDFAFLFVGHWIKGNYGEDRKDVGRMIKLFYETFANQKKQPAIVLKTSGATFSVIDKESIISKINNIKNQFPSDWNLPNIYLLHGDLTDSEMNSLYNHPKIKAMLSFTHGEGYGRPLQEATMAGLPVIASGWSGQVDFLDPANCILLQGTLNNVPESAVWENIIIPESKWFTVDETQAKDAMRYAFKNSFDFKTNALKLMNKNHSKFTHKHMTEKLGEILDKHMENIDMKQPEHKKIKLPKLKKIN